jgi:nucleotidyltransferase/DNA polymerase involved in DNA repair
MTLLYAEVPRFYAEVERTLDPSLASRPVVVGGDPRKRGLVQSATPDALAAGVAPGMPVLEALERCPGARVRRTNMRVYREVGARLRACFRRAAGRVEPAGLEAAYLEVEGDSAADAEALARRLQQEVRETLGLPLRVGIAPVKFVARLAAEEAGEEGIRRVSRDEVRAFLEPLPVERLPGVGPHTRDVFQELGVRSIGELAGAAREGVEERLGNHGLALLAAARGQGEARVRAAAHARSVSQETTLESAERDLGVLARLLADLAGGLAAGLARERLAAGRLVLKVRYADQETVTRSQTLARPVVAAEEIAGLGLDLLRRTQAAERAVRLLGLAALRLGAPPRDDRQLPLFGPED